MFVCAAYRGGGSENSFEAWSPDAASPAGRFVDLVYGLAWEVLSQRVSVERLEQLHGYLRPELPARLVPGDVPCLRLFGRVASCHQEELQRLFARLEREAGLVIDMTNFEGMGTLLYPTLVRFASTARRLAWACSKGARAQLESMRVPSAHVFDDTASAIAWVKEASN
jgi:hypothetical protein